MRKEILTFIGDRLTVIPPYKMVQIDAGASDPIIRIRYIHLQSRESRTAVFNQRTLDLASAGDEKAVAFCIQKVEQATGARLA